MFVMTNKGSDGQTLLSVACLHDQLSIVRGLLEHAANVNLSEEQGSRSTPLHIAVGFDHMDIAELLLSMHADLTIEDANGQTVWNQYQSDVMKSPLKKYGHHLSNDRSIDIYIYVKNQSLRDEQKCIAQVFRPCNAKAIDLRLALPLSLRRKIRYFTVAGRLLQFEKDETTSLSAVYRSRYSCARFTETPLHLTCCEGTKF
jgi:hypothetical protein